MSKIKAKTYGGLTEQEILQDLAMKGQDTTYHPIIKALLEEVHSLEDELDSVRQQWGEEVAGSDW